MAPLHFAVESIRNVSLLVASAVNVEGYREILGICEGTKEDKSGWSACLGGTFSPSRFQIRSTRLWFTCQPD